MICPKRLGLKSSAISFMKAGLLEPPITVRWELLQNSNVMISHQHVEAISTTKQEARWKQS
jgi:hypothetical protein